jgi:hypothetical protein
MRAAMRRYRDGEPTRLPYRVTRQMIAARYGTSPALVDEWPADDFADAVSTLEITGLILGGDRK